MAQKPGKLPAANPLPVPQALNETEEQAKGNATISAPVSTTMLIEQYSGDLLGTDTSLATVVNGLQAAMDRSKAGDLSTMEEMLVGQAMALQTMFVSLARRAQRQSQQRNLEAFMGMALKCQAQSRATIDSLVNLKYPRTTVIAKQANVNNGGQQQVNNGLASEGTRTCGTSSQPEQNGLLEVNDGQHGQRLDAAAAAAPARSNQPVEAVGAVDRAQDTRRQGRRRS